MKNSYLLIPALGLAAATPAMAQSSSVSSAVKGTMTQTPIQPQPLYIPPPAPPPPPPPPPPKPVQDKVERAPDVVSTLPMPLAPALVDIDRLAYPRNPRLLNSGEALPTPADYPAESWRNNEEGEVRYRIHVDAAGKATDCTILSSSGFLALDAKTCEVILERGQFAPALAGEDMPIAGRFERSSYWQKREPEFPTMLVTFRYVLNEKGQGTSCEILKIEGDIPDSMRRDMERRMERDGGCPIRPGRNGVPYRNENGVPIPKQVTVTFAVKVEDPAQ
jgi:protein TonB